ncbi:MAG: mitochondrial fusion and transport protein ugo1 [Icmadophila ericetorum]|nr:mitochondrial fusion and transport protein ugo1 [Icmadophila ericetorum]
MTSQREVSNPLRPYYKPPSIGLQPESAPNKTSTPSLAKENTRSSLGTSARDILSDLDYSDYLSDASPSAVEIIKALVDQALWKYTSVLLAQPFDVAKTLLQVQLGGAVQDGSTKASVHEDMRRKPGNYREGSYRDDPYDVPSDDSNADSPSYFTPATPSIHSSSRSSRPRYRNRGRRSPSRSPPITPSSSSYVATSPHTNQLTSRSSLTVMLSHLWSTEGAWGIWKGTNSTFIHSVLLGTITSFLRSVICAALALPDPGLSYIPSQPPYLLPMSSSIGGFDILSSPSPFTSLVAAVSAAGIAGILLAPLDIARTRLMLTPSTHPPRSLLAALKSLSIWTVPFSIAPITFLYSTIPTLISASTPLFLRSRLSIDPVLTPNMYSIATFASQVFELGVRLPLETVLRRGQIGIASAHTPTSPLSLVPSARIQTVVPIGHYKGIAGTVYHIIFEEGSRGDQTPEIVKGTGEASALKAGTFGKRRKGQGLEGLWRGWRVGMWGLVGVWGAALVGAGGGKGGEF